MGGLETALPAARLQTAAEASFKVLGVKVNAIQIPDVVAEMEDWIREREGCHFIAVTGMHGVTEAQHDVRFKRILNSADLVVPDGMPLVWLGRRHGYSLKRRVYGPELMETFCDKTRSRYRHFLYGGAPGVSSLLANRLNSKFGTNVTGQYAPPFRELTEDEDEEILDLIHTAAPDVLWVGLSTPKQERWMHRNRPRLKVPVVVGVGAAFDFHAGRTKQAPHWMREHGLEWLYRLSTEPRRLWRRYLIYGSQFVFNVAAEQLSLRRFD
jgi:N-acetylglucosaminyldiphosphoundecaprenol N-acetyl-beta-D-mannosaminyltransferase